MAFGIYVHTPYCLQRCTYCDFATYEVGTIIPPERYFQLLKEELCQRARFFPPQKLSSLYFGGGTPSLVEAKYLSEVTTQLRSAGFDLTSETECTIEINPATVSETKLSEYLDFGVNRFSVGAQTFKDSLLKSVRREHNSQDTLATLALLRKNNLNFSFDILFGLPNQSLADLKNDLVIAMDQGAKHISPYCLTVPEGHPLAKIRPPEDEQLEMFELIHSTLLANGYLQYEISNYAIPKHESQHNLLYWIDAPYWGLGLSAHSYSNETDWGIRFWNASNIKEYESQIERQRGLSFNTPRKALPQHQFEVLARNQALTDFCHTSLRLNTGLCLTQITSRFGAPVAELLLPICLKLIKQGVLEASGSKYRLTRSGQLVSNQIFERFTFLEADLSS